MKMLEDIPVVGARVVVVPNKGALVTLALDGGVAMQHLDREPAANSLQVGHDFFLLKGPDSLVARCIPFEAGMCRALETVAMAHVAAMGQGLPAMFEARVCAAA